MNEFPILSRILQIALILTFALALGGAFIPGTAGRVSGIACIAILIVAPVLRVAWLVAEWWREKDTRFALLATGLLAVLALGAAAAFLH